MFTNHFFTVRDFCQEIIDFESISMWTTWDPSLQCDTLSLLRHIADIIPAESTPEKVRNKNTVRCGFLQGLRLIAFPFGILMASPESHAWENT